MPQTISLLIFNSPIFPAHWALWLPHPANSNTGKLINAVGDAATGFEIIIEREYDLRNITQRYQLVALDEVSDVKEDGRNSKDSTAYDCIEKVALSVPAPKKSLVSATIAEGSRHRVEIQNCQTWLRQVVAALVQADVVDEAALQIVDGAPKN
ncbi:uncharacterized protein BDZ99DRAFT_469349 [Mytilinidion resinicola]|uniref:Uncharacterized protein n=1 Tax=Mytilinidion resinicola TaxID=574789 RepID=A0A6A6XZ39_9PEZI|nr:uncharacterized protein BDZ99DRAFT_469349 [Mytilinidion resinicola]KAF2801836.1 hypothetical protein BDZ99DRAFT_469349 [Mytilinidion resinicola]